MPVNDYLLCHTEATITPITVFTLISAEASYSPNVANINCRSQTFDNF